MSIVLEEHPLTHINIPGPSPPAVVVVSEIIGARFMKGNFLKCECLNPWAFMCQGNGKSEDFRTL